MGTRRWVSPGKTYSEIKTLFAIDSLNSKDFSVVVTAAKFT